MKQVKFNLEESYGYHFNTIFTNIKRMMENRLKTYDVTHLQFSILVNLYKNNVKTQKEMLQYVNGDEANITRLINRLESKGFLKRVQSTEDKRKKHIVLTQSGIDLAQKTIACAQEVNNELIKVLDEKESKQLLKLLQKVHTSVEKL